MIELASFTFSDSERTLNNLHRSLVSMYKILSRQSMMQLPKVMLSTLGDLYRIMVGFLPGSAGLNLLVSYIKLLDLV
ncbi:hypothetical protein ACNITT_26820, partial [Escherichia coli]